MTFEEFKASLAQPSVGGLPPALRALREDARGHSDAAHTIAQDIDGKMGAWIHAYLHRKEGNSANAGYWYRRAGQPPARDSLEEEWARIVRAALSEFFIA